MILRITFSLIQVIIGTSASVVGAVGGTSQSSILSEVSTSLITKPSATGEIPKFGAGMSAPSVNVGGGGSGAKDQQYRAPRSEGKPLTEKIGEMIDESQKEGKSVGNSEEASSEGTVLRERSSDEPPNPKKRMWEEPLNPLQQSGRPRDEL